MKQPNKQPSIAEFLRDIARMQDEYLELKISGFVNRTNTKKIVQPFMEKYEFSYEAAVRTARNEITYHMLAKALEENEARLQDDEV